MGELCPQYVLAQPPRGPKEGKRAAAVKETERLTS